MGVITAEPEGADRRASPPSRPRFVRRQEAQWAVAKLVDGVGDAGRRGERSIVDRGEEFEQTGRAGGGQQMAHVRLHRADGQWPLSSAEEAGGRPGLDRIAEQRTRGVALQQLHRLRAESRLLVRRAHGADLAFFSGHEKPAGPPVVR